MSTMTQPRASTAIRMADTPDPDGGHTDTFLGHDFSLYQRRVGEVSIRAQRRAIPGQGKSLMPLVKRR
jgi:hypothetical protein